MVVLSSKFSILISWSPICIPLIVALASMKTASVSAAIMHNNIESGQPWWNPWMRVKDSIRRPFILILVWYWWKQLESCKEIYSCNRTYEGEWDPRETSVFERFGWKFSSL